MIVPALERASEGSRELDAGIHFAIGAITSPYDAGALALINDPEYAATFGRMLPHYTTSLDAALTLLEPGLEWALTNIHGIARADVGINRMDAGETCIREDGNTILAFVTAALRARMKRP